MDTFNKQQTLYYECSHPYEKSFQMIEIDTKINTLSQEQKNICKKLKYFFKSKFRYYIYKLHISKLDEKKDLNLSNKIITISDGIENIKIKEGIMDVLSSIPENDFPDIEYNQCLQQLKSLSKEEQDIILNEYQKLIGISKLCIYCRKFNLLDIKHCQYCNNNHPKFIASNNKDTKELLKNNYIKCPRCDKLTDRLFVENNTCRWCMNQYKYYAVLNYITSGANMDVYLVYDIIQHQFNVLKINKRKDKIEELDRTIKFENILKEASCNSLINLHSFAKKSKSNKHYYIIYPFLKDYVTYATFIGILNNFEKDKDEKDKTMKSNIKSKILDKVKSNICDHIDKIYSNCESYHMDANASNIMIHIPSLDIIFIDFGDGKEKSDDDLAIDYMSQKLKLLHHILKKHFKIEINEELKETLEYKLVKLYIFTQPFTYDIILKMISDDFESVYQILKKDGFFDCPQCQDNIRKIQDIQGIENKKIDDHKTLFEYTTDIQKQIQSIFMIPLDKLNVRQINTFYKEDYTQNIMDRLSTLLKSFDKNNIEFSIKKEPEQILQPKNSSNIHIIRL